MINKDIDRHPSTKIEDACLICPSGRALMMREVIGIFHTEIVNLQRVQTR